MYTRVSCQAHTKLTGENWRDKRLSTIGNRKSAIENVYSPLRAVLLDFFSMSAPVTSLPSFWDM